MTCEYSAFGGLRALIGGLETAEIGVLEATVDNGLIVEVARITEDGDEAWFELASWVAATHPTAFEEAFGTINEGWILQPTYTGAAALTQAELAIMFARLTGSRTLPLG